MISSQARTVARQFVLVITNYWSPGAVLGKNIWEAWPLISSFGSQQRAELAVSSCPVLSNLCTVINLKIWGAWARFGGPVPLAPT